jgi:hypothetical protein
MAIKQNVRVRRGLITYAIAFICLAAVFVINLFLSFARDLLDESVNQDDANSASIFLIIILISLASSCVIAINNVILEAVVAYISKFERHESYTKFNLTVSIKLVV